MSLFVRTLLIWLLVLAMPAQAVGAATMAFCGPGHHGGAAPRAEMDITSGHAHHGHAVSVQALGSGAGVEATPTDAAAAVEMSSQATTQTCSACASCCTVGAIPGTAPGVPITDAAPTVFTTVAPAVDAFAAAGPERPPRQICA
jgi:hypothetical protein